MNSHGIKKLIQAMYPTCQHPDCHSSLEFVMLRKKLQERANEIKTMRTADHTLPLHVFGDLEGSLPLPVCRVSCPFRVDFQVTKVPCHWRILGTQGKRAREGFDPFAKGLEKGWEVLHQLSVVEHGPGTWRCKKREMRSRETGEIFDCLPHFSVSFGDRKSESRHSNKTPRIAAKGFEPAYISEGPEVRK